MLMIMMLTVTNLTLTRLELIEWFLTKQIIGRNCYLKKHKSSLNTGLNCFSLIPPTLYKEFLTRF